MLSSDNVQSDPGELVGNSDAMNLLHRIASGSKTSPTTYLVLETFTQKKALDTLEANGLVKILLQDARFDQLTGIAKTAEFVCEITPKGVGVSNLASDTRRSEP